VLAFLEISRAAFLSLGRRLGPWLLGLAVLAGVGWFANSDLTRVLIIIGAVTLVGGAIPAVAGTGLRSWLRAGPLGLADRGGGYFATVGYGIGAALVAMPFVLAATSVANGTDLHQLPEALGFAIAAVLVVSWLGAAAGRLVESAMAVVMLSWVGAAAVAGGTFVATVGIKEFSVVPVTEGAFVERFSYDTWGPFIVVGLAVVATHALMWLASRVDQRAPTHPGL